MITIFDSVNRNLWLYDRSGARVQSYQLDDPLSGAQFILNTGYDTSVILLGNGYSGFDSALSRNVVAKGHFSQENDPSHNLQRATPESKPL